MSADIEIDLDVRCAVCKQPLDYSVSGSLEPTVLVTPCDPCYEKAKATP